MKKIVMLLIAVAAFAATASAQKFAFIDQEYILKKIPNYEMANEQLNQISQRWQREVETLEKEADTMYKNYQADMVFLTDEQRRRRKPKSWLRKRKPLNSNINTSVHRANSTKSSSRSSSLFKTTFMPLAKRCVRKRAIR